MSLPSTIAQAIAHHAATAPDRTALRLGNERMTYAQLQQAIDQECQRLGTLQGQSVPFRATCTFDTVVRYFAIHRAGGVAVPLEKDYSESLFLKMQQQLAAKPCPQGTADLLFTTGTTGTPKGVMVSHRAMVANADNLVGAQGYSPDITFIVNGPLNHIGSLSKLYATMLAGGTAYLLDGIKDFDAFFATVRAAEGKVATFLVPASIRLLMTFAADALAEVADRIEFVETGAAPIMQPDMERLCRLLPHARLFNTYASTETGIIATHDYNSDLCQSGVLGRPMRHSHLHINAAGHVVCSGDTLMTGYWDNPALTAQLLTADGLVTNDVGTLDVEGRLCLQGRNDDVINVGGFKVAPTEVEEQVLASGMVRDCICTPFTHPVIGTAVQLLVVVDPQANFNKRALLLWLKERLESYKLPQRLQVVDHIERMKNGKLNRKAYR